MKARIKSGLLGIIPMLALSGIGEAFGQSSSDGQIPKPAARRSAVSFGKPAPVVSLQKPKPIYSNKPETQNSEDTLDGLQWLPKMIVRGAMPDGGGDGQTVSLYGPPPVPPPTESANPFPPAGGPPGGPPGPPPPTVGAPISDVPVAPSGNSNWWNKTCDWFKNSCSPHSDSKGGLFHSDCAYEGMFVTPISNPFLTEDPRSLTEIRPLYIYQTIPTKNNSFEELFFVGIVW